MYIYCKKIRGLGHEGSTSQVAHKRQLYKLPKKGNDARTFL